MLLSIFSVETVCFLLMLLFVSFTWYRKNNSASKSICFSIWTCLIFVFNAPNFLSIDNAASLNSNPLLTFAFNLHDIIGSSYTLISNALLAAVGCYLGESNRDRTYSNHEVKKQFDSFITDAANLKIIGRDLDFLLSNDYSAQYAKILKLGNNAQILCEQTNDARLVELYHTLIDRGIDVRSYASRDGITNLKGQIKITERNESSGIFVNKISGTPSTASKPFQITKMESGYLLGGVKQQFDRTFENSLHPTISCIALDLGGVYLDGDIDSFYKFLSETYKIHIKKSRKDRLNIDNDLMLGRITIRDFIMQNAPKAKTSLSQNEWDKILTQWQQTWIPNTMIKRVIEDLHKEYGYTIIPFSNLDRENGDKYIRDHYLPECCEHRFFSYEMRKSKPSNATFRAFFDFVKSLNCGINNTYQLLLIDDEAENINAAKGLGWYAINFYNDSSSDSVETFITKLKQMHILPADYSPKSNR